MAAVLLQGRRLPPNSSNITGEAMASKSQPILPSKVQRAEYGRTVYSATLEEGVTVSDITKSDFWVHLAPQLNDLDHIEAITADGETYVELLVSRIEKLNDGNRTVRIPKVVVLHETKLGAESKAAQKARQEREDAPGFVAPAEDESVRNQQTNNVITGETEPTPQAPSGLAPENEAIRNQQTNNMLAGEDAPDDADGDGVPDGYKVAYGGPTHKHRVLKDGVTEPIASGMTKKDAIAWAVEHAKKSA